MKSGESLDIPFRVIITNPGVYNFNCLRFQIGVVSKLDNNYSKLNQTEDTSPPAFDEDELIPLQLSFVVKYVSSN